MDTLECSFCPRELDDSPAVAEALVLAGLGTLVGTRNVAGWLVFFTGTTEPTVICDRCRDVAAPRAALALLHTA